VAFALSYNFANLRQSQLRLLLPPSVSTPWPCPPALRRLVPGPGFAEGIASEQPSLPMFIAGVPAVPHPVSTGTQPCRRNSLPMPDGRMPSPSDEIAP
jgi:hypothetical protein